MLAILSLSLSKPVGPINQRTIQRYIKLSPYICPNFVFMSKIKIGVLREEKIPADMRVPLTPLICSELTKQYSNLEIYVQPSSIRCYSDNEYIAFGITLK